MQKLSLRKKMFLRGIFVLLVILGLAFPIHAVEKLPPCNADLSQTTVSGLSSGAFMATQFHVAYSNLIVGAGIIAGGPYYCSGSHSHSTFNPPIFYLSNAMNVCMAPIAGTGPDADELFKRAEEFASNGWIDPLENLKNDRVYIFSGSSDRTVLTSVVNETEAFYKKAGVPSQNIRYNKSVNAGHCISVAEYDTPCPETKSPYINDCDFIQSHRILTHLYGRLNPPATTLSSKVQRFDQSAFLDKESLELTCMSDTAYIYIPKSCETESCKVHVAFHGCLQSDENIGDKYYTQTGYNELADTNNIILLYPQVEKSIPANPMGCWDFWGYSNPNRSQPNFYRKSSLQMTAFVHMLDRLAQSRN